ncbi:HYR domain-containing protein [Geomonas propionica]|uniref:HYR domain-containing protein n=1 Tax=Geomonas propionica TaxID=2798582 RepID=A0ABS0YMZ8_9BACT|nr:HYR domain-containing protein [Geomonas propionica]MBJ6799317.1 HYR domain-containing protein [Geomonas propionica]
MKRELLSAFASLLIAAPVMACNVDPQISPANQRVPEKDLSGIPTLVKLNGQPSKDTTGYFWEQTAGPTVTLSNPTAAQPSFSAPEVESAGATLTFRLTVSGCSPLQSKSITTNVTLSNVVTNRPPVASATFAPSAVYEGTLVTLDGGNSSDPDGNTLTYQWTQLTGSAVTLTADGAKATFTAPTDVPFPDGTSLSFQLTVSDGTLASSTEQIVNVLWVNDAPKAALSCPETVNEGAQLTLNGSGSSDSDNGIASYNWTQSLGTPNATLPLYDAATASTLSFAAPYLDSVNDTMTFKLLVTDAGTLTNSKQCSVKVLDITAPVLANVPADMTAEAASAAGAEVGFTLPSAKDNVDGDLTVVCAPASGATFPLGTSTVTCSVSDAAKNGVSGNFTIKVQDTTAPAVTAPAGVVAEATAPSSPVTIGTATATDAVGVKEITSDAPAAYPVGTTVVTWTARDAAGNSSTATQSITVKDTTAPVVNPPTTVTLEATGPSTNLAFGSATGTAPSGTATASGAFGTATASDAVGVTSLTSDAPASFPVGTTVVTWTAKDAAGNTGTATQSVTVKDTTAPKLEGVPNGFTLIIGQAATYEPTATDLVDGSVPVACTPASGSSLPLGTSTVTCSAKDAHGNTSSAKFDVNVQYGFNGLLAPYDANKSYKIKSAIPLKWQFTNSSGTVLASVAAKPSVIIQQVNNGVVSSDVVTLDDAGFSGLQYDSLTNTWQFNWKTTGYGDGLYNVYILSGLPGQKIGPFSVKLAK